jgi:CHASE1-domain containing sensor protein/tRNA A-37 threonylcarbamoyl transferase component Bud32
MRRWWWIPLAVLSTGSVLTVTAARITTNRASAARRQVLERTAEQLGFAVTERVRLPAESVQTLGAFVAYGPPIDRATFESVAASIYERTPRLYALEWAPFVGQAQRADVETRARAEGRPGWRIAERPRYLPILHAYPDNPGVGFDVLSRPEAAAVFRQACSSGHAVFSPRYRLVEDAEDIASLILYEPVWHGGPPDDADARCRDISGVAILIFRVGDMVGDAIAQGQRRGIDVVLEDITDGKVEVLYESRPQGATRAAQEVHRDVPLALYGRAWRLRVGDATEPSLPLTPLAVGAGLSALATVLAGGLAWFLAHRRRLRAMTQLGQYRVECEIGRGAMGVVYRAQHLLLQRPAALKILAPDLIDAASRARFEREVRLAAKLQHPSVVQVYDFGVTAEGLFFYAMELLEGITVRDLVAEYGAVPAPRAAEIVRQVAQALREAHGKRIIHRDLAPANLMITVRGETYDVVKVLDFGLVKRIRPVGDEERRHAHSESGIVIGSPGFIAPEVLRGGDADERVDIYALGVVWYTLLAGRAPFTGATATAVIQSQLRAAPAPLHKLAPDLPLPLVELVIDAMQPDPRLRLRSMSELLKRLDALALPAWSQDQARRWWKDHRDAR